MTEITAIAPPMLDALVEKYIALRDRKAELKAKFKADTEAIDAGMAKCEAYFLTEMRRQGLTALPTEAGVPYQSTQTSVTVADWPAYFAWMQAGERWEFLDHKANKTAVVAYKEEHQDLPPGLNWREEIVVNVRRK